MEARILILSVFFCILVGVSCDSDCPKDKEPCMGTNGKRCGGRGACICAKCDCVDDWRGPTCEDAKGLPVGHMCERYKLCVQCKILQRGPFNTQECNTNCSGITIKEVKSYNDVPVEKADKMFCRFKEPGCYFTLEYEFDAKNVYAERPMAHECGAAALVPYLVGIFTVVRLVLHKCIF